MEDKFIKQNQVKKLEKKLINILPTIKLSGNYSNSLHLLTQNQEFLKMLIESTNNEIAKACADKSTEVYLVCIALTFRKRSSTIWRVK